jgi:deoxyribodipyrimidine photo-lyase
MAKPFRRAICWVRRDLRLRDHAALARATRNAEEVAVAFVFDRNILDVLEDPDDRRVSFIHASLEEMDAKLRKIGSKLVVLHGDPTAEIPRLAEEIGAEAVFAARDAEAYAQDRDHAVTSALAEKRRKFDAVKDTVVFEASEMPYEPHPEFERGWRARLNPNRDLAYFHADRAALMPGGDLPNQDWSLKVIGFRPSTLIMTPGEDAARKRLATFLPKIPSYRRNRHAPARTGTSGLSVDLRFGTISIRECVRAALAHPSPGAKKWLTELIWRDYYHAELERHPGRTYAYTAGVSRPSHGEAWRQGQTGYPLVDAAMRCLRATGTMPNRLRMVAASFFVNDLLLDPAEGEAWFARFLLDFDLASNRGNWRWCAGADAPYRPRLNAVLQSERYDPEAEFVLSWVPEIGGLIGPALHFPPRATPLELEAAGLILGEDYPWPIVDRVAQRQRAQDSLFPG